MNAILRELVTRAWQMLAVPYDERARIEEAPGRFSATSFIVWLYADVGVKLEDDLLVLHRSGRPVLGSDLEAADLVFRSGRHDRYHPGDPSHGIGHVGVHVGGGVIIHASAHHGRVAPSEIDWFLNMENGKFRGVRRILART